jgi:hypothetical protein
MACSAKRQTNPGRYLGSALTPDNLVLQYTLLPAYSASRGLAPEEFKVLDQLGSRRLMAPKFRYINQRIQLHVDTHLQPRN